MGDNSPAGTPSSNSLNVATPVVAPGAVTVSEDNEASQALYRGLGYEDSGVPPRRVVGTIMLRKGPLDVDETLLLWSKRLNSEP